MKLRFAAATAIASLLWLPTSTRTVSAIYCYPGDPPAVYQACLAYNAGIGQQVSNQQQLQTVQAQITDAVAQITSLNSLMKRIGNQIASQKALILQTQATIDDLDRRIRLGEASLTELKATMSVRNELLDQRLRNIDSHGAINYLQLVLTASSFNDLMNRMIGAQQVAASDKRLLDQLQQERALVIQAGAVLGTQRVQVGTFSWLSFSVVTLGFGFSHSAEDRIAALLTGVLYNWVAYRTKSLASCVLVHAVTNFLLGLWIMQTRQWGFW